MLSFDPSRHVHIDWRVAGADWLPLLRDEFSSIAQLQGSTFEALLDELAHEDVAQCMQTLANILNEHGYEVWNIDAGADDFRVALVPVGERTAFERYWKVHTPSHFEGEVVDIELKRIEPEDAPQQDQVGQASQAQTDQPGKRKKKPDWLAETRKFNSFTASKRGIHDGRVLATRSGQSGDGGRVREWWFWNMDLRQWPPTFELVHQIHSEDNSPMFPQLAAASGDLTLWQWHNFDDSRAAEHLRGYRNGDWKSFGPPDDSTRRASSSEGADLWHEGWLWRVRYLGETCRWQVSRTSANSTQLVYDELENPGQLHPFGPARVLLMAERSCRIWEAGHMSEAVSLPVPTAGPHAVAWLGGNEILYFDHIVRDVLAPWWRGQVLRAWRFDVVSGISRCAELDGFGVQYNAPPLEVNGAIKKRKSMSAQEHGLQLARGHGEWWVINYEENVHGVRTIAWFWNAATNEVVKITSKDIPRWEPAIVYVAEMDRYLGLDWHGVIRLPVFETIRAANGGSVLSWNKPRTATAGRD